VAQERLAQGGRIRLKAGDTWAESFQSSWSGNFDEATFLSTYTSTLATRQTFWNASSEFTGKQSKALAAGADSTTAAARATEWCRRLAVVDALAAARDAADATSQWIVLERYGTGANPKIAPGGAATTALRLTGTGGWKRIGVDLGGATTYGFRSESLAKGIWEENCTTDGIAGGTVNNPATPYNGTTNAYLPTGSCLSNVTYAFSKNCTISNTGGSPRYLTACAYVLDENLISDTSTVQSDYVQFSTTVVRKGGRITGLCASPGYPSGGAGVLWSNSTDVFVFDAELDHNHESPPGSTTSGDGVAVDFEDGVVNGTVARCNIHDNADAPILLSKSGGHALSGTMIVGNTCTNNGLKSVSQTPCLVHNLVDSVGDQAFFCDNVTHRAVSGQKLFAHLGPPGTLNDTPESHWLYGTDNTVAFP
jgi:hypothetical protein